METQLLATDTPASMSAAVEQAAAFLTAREPVALPTETVYGLAADALRPEAAVKIFEAKERPFFDPLIVHLPDREWLERITAIPEESRPLVEALIEKFWPGPLTLVLPRREIVPDIVTAGLGTVAVRMSAHAVFQAVVQRFGRPLAAPSANRFGRISPTTAQHVRSELDGRIPCIVDGGATEHGLESTIVKIEGIAMHILRAGPVTSEDLSGFGEVHQARAGAIPDAPGQLKSHYAPTTRMILLGPGVKVRYDASRTGKLQWTPWPADYPPETDQTDFAACEVLSATGDLREAAATLFAKMRRLDEAGLDVILAETVPERGLGIAIMDRLRKAAAEHE